MAKPEGWFTWSAFAKASYIEKCLLAGRGKLTQIDLADSLGINSCTLRSYLRALKLCESVKKKCIDHRIDISIIKYLSALEPFEQEALIDRVIAEHWTCKMMMQYHREQRLLAEKRFTEEYWCSEGLSEKSTDNEKTKRTKREVWLRLHLECKGLPSRL